MKTRSKNKLQIKKTIEDQSDKEDLSENYYIKAEEKPEWSQQRLTLTYIPQTLIGRERERQDIYEFVKNCVMNKINCKVLYISGVPGVGKTASTMQIMKKIGKELKGKMDYFYVNSLTLKKPKDIYKIIYQHLCPTNGKKSQSCDKNSEDKGFYGNQIQKFLKTTKKNHILIVDEVDFLFTKDQKVFYNLFQWTSQITTKFSLIIIANIMDFPQKLSTKVSSRMGTSRLVFSPYTQPQIMLVVEDRLKGCTLFTQRAVLYASKKLAGYSSDIRTILQVLLKSVKQHKEEKKTGQIETEAIMKLWNQKFGILIQLQQDLAPLHLKIIQYVKNHGGECISKNLHQILDQSGVRQPTTSVLLKELEEMGMVQLRQVALNGFFYKKIRLVESLLL